LDGCRNGARDIGLQAQHVAQVSFVGFGPKVRVCPCTDQLRRDPNTVSRPQHRTLDHRVYVQLAGNLWQRPLGAFVLHHRRSRNHAQRGDLCQVGDEFVSHPIGEILVLRVM
jgi:hypothetical protein